jgi:hypothetical protein
METAAFWAIVDESRNTFDPRRTDGNMEAQVDRFQELLAELTPAELMEFQREFETHMHRAYRWDLWGAAYVIEGGCSDDGFTDFRSWLISLGREAYESALRDPESLLDVAHAAGIEVASFEEFQYVPMQVYEAATDEEMPDTGVEHPAEPAGEPWSEEGEDLAQRFPKLWEKYGDA